jgi:hypothetical protein
LKPSCKGGEQLSICGGLPGGRQRCLIIPVEISLPQNRQRGLLDIQQLGNQWIHRRCLNGRSGSGEMVARGEPGFAGRFRLSLGLGDPARNEH